MASWGCCWLRHRYSHTSGGFLLPSSVVASWLLLIAPVLFLSAGEGSTVERAIAAAVSLALATVLFDRLRRGLRDYPCDPARWQLQALLGAVCSTVALVPLLRSH